MVVSRNNDCYNALEGKDLQASAMAVDISGTYALLAGRKYIAIRNLERENESVKRFPRHSKYDVSAVEWNPTPLHREICVISSNQKLEILTWRMESLMQTHSLKAHARVITDLNWNRFDPNQLASCSADSFIHLWDLRDIRRPALSMFAVAEATDVRWNRMSSQLLATAHEGDVRIWDQRKGSAPLLYISAHQCKIHDLDWSRHSPTELATSSQDNTVKFFDINNPKKPEFILTTNAPVWRGRYAPFGKGMVTVVVPSQRRGEQSLHLWNTSHRSRPVHTFNGQNDVILEFAWRKQCVGNNTMQLVTWSNDQNLIIYNVESPLQKLCGSDSEKCRDELIKEVDIDEALNKKIEKVLPLEQEFLNMDRNIPNLEIKSTDPIGRNCIIQATVNKFILKLQVNFPIGYPENVLPVFQVIRDSVISELVATHVLQTLNHMAQQFVSKNQQCLEPCLRQLVATLEQVSSNSEAILQNSSSLESPSILHGSNDAYIPFPRTSGAKFCSVNHLVVFGRPTNQRRLSGKQESTTPRALSALEGIYSKRSSTDSNITVSSYYFQNRSKTKPKAVVQIHNASGLFLINRQLAEEYILDGDVSTICKHNAAAAALVGRSDLVQAWTLAELVASPQQADEENTWASHPFGNQLMQSLISHYAEQNDIQMAAMLCCIFGKEQECSSLRKSSLKSLLSPGLIPGKRWLKSGGSPYHTIPPADVIADGWVFSSLKTTRSSSLDNLRLEEIAIAIPQRSSYSSVYEYYKLAYAEILYRWGLLYNRAEVLKYMCTASEPHKGVEFLTDCRHCLKPAKYCTCSSCKRLSLNCIICHISVRGSANCCVVCGHGGHTKHLKQWFDKSDICPSGCGCHCLQETAGMFAGV